ncbi:MAG TPA: hypothetical protein VJL28_04760 [Gemmatimonadaceae bacterium]|nr:hypothetical protein [Gemmatimonadaceae bacterium]
MLVLQAVPVRDADAFKLLRARIRQASTWNWANKRRTRLKHVQRPDGGFIQVADAGGVLVAHIHPKTPNDLFYLAEKFTGRLIAWFEHDLLSINIQVVPEPVKATRRKRKPGVRRRTRRVKRTARRHTRRGAKRGTRRKVRRKTRRR